MSFEYLLLPRLQFQGVNAQASWWLMNAAPVMAATQFAHNFGRKTGSVPAGIALVHHDAQFLGERSYGKFRPQQKRGAGYINKDDYSSKNPHALSLQPTASLHLTWSLLLAFDVSEGAPGLTDVDTFLTSAKLGGGNLIDAGKPQILGSLEEIDKRIRGGYWIVERQDLLQNSPDGKIKALIEAITQKPVSLEPASEGRDAPEPVNSWVVPTTLGYAALTGLGQRAGAREGLPHAYAEPLIGLVQYVSVNKCRGILPRLWRQKWLQDDVIIITQNEA